MTDYPRFSNDDQTGQGEPATNSPMTENVGTRGSSIPVSAIVAIFFQLLTTIFLIAFGIWLLLDTSDPPVNLEIRFFLLIRLGIALGVLIGMRHRKRMALKVSRGLCTAGLIFGAVIVISILTVGITMLGQFEFLEIVSAQWIVWAILVVSLNTESADKWFTK